MEIHTIGNKRNFVLLFLLLGSAKLFSLGAGLFYPKKVFSIENVGKNFYWGAADKACDMATELTPEINVIFRQSGNSFKSELYPIFLTKKKYAKIYIKEIMYIYENTEISVLNDSVFIFPEQIVEVGSNKSGWITNGTYYWLSGWDAKSDTLNDKSKLWPQTNFEKVFKNRRIGDQFSFSIRIIYSFDDENERSLEIPYTVKTLKGKFVSPFSGM